MHILVFNWQDRTHPQGGGAEVHLHEIFGRIAAQGHKVTLVCCGHSGAPSRETLDGIDVIRTGNRPTFNYMVPLWWWKYGADLNPDIVVDDINKLPFFTPKFIKKPILALVHHFFGDSIFNEVGWAAGTYVQMFEKRIPKVYGDVPVCAVSESTRDECIENGFRPEQLSIIHNAIDHRDYPMKVTQKADVPTIVSFGRLKKYKSIDQLIKAVAIVRETIPEVQLNILGTGDERPALERLVDFHDLSSTVNFAGFVSDEEKVEHLSRAHVVVNASIKEGWGITNIEANACGTPVVSANVPGLRDSVRDGSSGILYPYGDVEQMAKILTRILVDDPERQRLSDGAVAWASTFTWERSASEMITLCERTIEQWTP